MLSEDLTSLPGGIYHALRGPYYPPEDPIMLSEDLTSLPEGIS